MSTTTTSLAPHGVKRKSVTQVAQIWYTIATIVIWIAAWAGGILGVMLATKTVDDGGRFFVNYTHPYVGVGIGITIAAIFFAVVAQAVLTCLWAIVSNTKADA